MSSFPWWAPSVSVALWCWYLVAAKVPSALSQTSPKPLLLLRNTYPPLTPLECQSFLFSSEKPLGAGEGTCYSLSAHCVVSTYSVGLARNVASWVPVPDLLSHPLCLCA